MAAAPDTPTRARSHLRSGTNEVRLAPTVDPQKPATRCSTTKLTAPTAADPFKASSVSSAPPSRSSSTSSSASQKITPGWTEKDGLNVVISARHHETKLAKTCSWMHMWEHSRYLHAGLPQKQINWDAYPERTSEDTPLMRNIHRYLSSRTPRTYVRQPDISLETAFPEIESKEELQAAFFTGAIHFGGELSIVKESRDGQRKVVFTMCPPSADMGSALYRKWGSDRFLRIKLDDDALRCCGPSFDRPEPASKLPSLRDQLRSFFSRPLSIFGRQYSPFCAKDGAVFYFAEKGTGIETPDERTLSQFAQQYLDVRLNPRMTVAKYCARFELGLTTTTPTVTFPRHRVLRTPDLKSDSLKISFGMMQHLRDLFVKTFPGAPREFLPSSYLPSCIRGFYGTVADDKVMTPLVWQLDYTSPESEGERYIQVHQLSSDLVKVARLHFKFTILLKDGRECSIWPRLSAEQFRWEPEWRDGGKRGVDMTDGCSLMSYSAMRIVAEMYSEARGAIEMQPSIPPVAQGRLGPGKGVWAVAPLSSWNSNSPDERWIEVRDSQWKFEDQQTETFTFELHSIPSKRGESAKLGKQMFEVLSHCGVPSSVFRDMLRSQVETTQTAFWAPPSMPALLYSVEKCCGVIEDRTLKAKLTSDPSNVKFATFDTNKLEDDVDVIDQAIVSEGEGFVHDRRLDPVSAAPNTVPEVVVQMLQNGFEPRKNPHLAAKLKIVASMSLDKQLSFKVDDEYSRTAFVIADHMGVLNEGEFFFQVGEPLPVGNGFGRTGIVDGEALLSRSPAVQPCDVQKVRGVYRPEYRGYYDVIIVSTKGDRSLCSILSGGDYDGDKLICMTNPALVTPFVNADHKFADPPFEDSDWFDVDRRKVGDHVGPIISSGDDERLAAIFLESLFGGTQFGLLSKYHTTLAYKLGIDHPLTSEAGHLFCRALDGRKQGLSFSAEKWQLAKKKFFEPHREVPLWTYAEAGLHAGHHERFAVRPRELPKHPMDELDRERSKVKRTTEDAWREWCHGLPVEIDDDLAREWRGAWTLGLQQRSVGNTAFFEDLERILSHVKTVFQEYKNLFARWARDKDNGKSETDRSNAPGSPTKRSPSKKGTEWKSSSRSQKDELLALTRRFWSVLDPSTGSLRSEKLRGEDGARYARSLIASCSYLEPLRPTLTPPPVGCSTLIDRFRGAAANAVPSLSSISTPPTTIASSSTTLATTSTPLEEEDFDDLFGDTRYSQIATQPHQVVIQRKNDVPITSVETALPATSSSQSSSANPLSPLANRSTSTAETSTKPIVLDISFKDSNRSAIKFCYDMAHRSVLALKANSITARLHGAGARGIEAPSVAETILDVLSVSKRASGIASARLKVRPRTLLSTASTSPDGANVGSPAKRQRIG
ncbi:hypothetical protein JCM11491_003670 [Sporobolomyces phaffii]